MRRKGKPQNQLTGHMGFRKINLSQAMHPGFNRLDALAGNIPKRI